MSENIDDVLEKLRHLVDGSETMEVLTKDELASIRKVIKIVAMLESWGKLGRLLFWLLSLVAGAFIAWEAVSTRVLKWLAGS